GGSAGGHLAAFTGMVEGLDDPADDVSVSARPDALILFNPVVDNGPGGWGNGRVKDRYKEFSPAHNISKDDPPSIVFLGSKDRLIPVKTLEDFQANLRKEGVRCEVFVYDDQAHGFFNQEPWTSKTLIEADRFLESLGWLSGPPPLKDPEK
ncbi:alpha/beta hydrolase, partial [Singulisphaera rosea]